MKNSWVGPRRGPPLGEELPTEARPMHRLVLLLLEHHGDLGLAPSHLLSQRAPPPHPQMEEGDAVEQKFSSPSEQDRTLDLSP